MIYAKHIEAMMKKCEVHSFCVLDIDENALFDFKCATSASAIQEWKDIQKFLTGHKVITIVAAGKNRGSDTGKKSYEWEVTMKEEPGTQISGQNNSSSLTVNDIERVLDSKIKDMRKDIELEYLRKQVAGKGEKKSDAELLLGFLDKTMSGEKKSTGLAGGPDDLGVKTEPNAAELEHLMEKLLQKVSYNKVVYLMKIMEKFPFVADKAIASCKENNLTV